ncbi:MAG: PASTA domain-containing protein, partial [Acidimicrobiales bacterium]|nr:PASTA domain-containing protein [Acidimicrobiales bacterium]
YLADDVKLRRRVALKMLHDALAGDAEFLRRFRAEARAAAALSHPNIMAVYDWSDGSDDGDAAFIVTEYLAGGSLRALLDAGAQLSPAQALGVGVEAARALDYAHRRGFVHRDVKPANLLFGEEQRLRIADFGLARALAEAAWTEPQGAVLGTARYASPEQAKGESLTGKADVYALALVIIEAVTGEVPFVADTTLGTLMARVDRPLVVPEALGPLQPILTDAGRPDPDARIDARTLAKGLLRAAKELPRPAPLPLAGAIEAGAAGLEDQDPTALGPTAAVAAGAVAAATVAGAAANDLTDDDLDLDPPAWVNQSDADAAPGTTGVVVDDVAPVDDVAVDPDPGTDDPVPAPLVAPAAAVAPPGDETDEVAAVGAEDGEDDEGGRRRRWPWVAAIVVLLGLVGGGVAYALTLDEPADAGPLLELPVPRLVGLDEAAATEIAESAGWSVTTVTKRQNDSVAGEVLDTSPAAGDRLAEGATITLTVSEGQEIVDVPGELAGMTFDDARAALAEVGLEAEVADTPYDEDVPKDSVVRVAEGTPGRLERGSTVRLVVSNGPEPRVVPSGLVGSTRQAATEALEALGLEVAVVESFSDDVAEGIVISVLPGQGETVARGTTINVEVSKGPELVAVPDVSGADDLSEAVAILRASGFVEGDVRGPAGGSPQGTSPAAGSLARPGSTVDIVMG